ncbi:hypothetical protein [Aquimonas voraii]|uniref:hypothetical protein n=1 Tax=Aquimonas voraii TaxID=265719 RepID=UPI00115FB29C|nr:hypothetical protein [Aquimonas voraii]
MCLEILASIAPEAKSRISTERLSQLCGLAVSSRKVRGVPSLHFSVTGGCSCEFLSDDADFESETWTLAPDHLAALSHAVSALSKECRKFSFVAHWLNGERPRRTERVSGSALAKLVSENKVGNNVLYIAG